VLVFQRAVSQEQCLVVAFRQLRRLSNGERADSHSDRNGRRAIGGHCCAKSGVEKLVIARRTLCRTKRQRAVASVCRCLSCWMTMHHIREAQVFTVHGPSEQQTGISGEQPRP
jgi:hypothetical protein